MKPKKNIKQKASSLELEQDRQKLIDIFESWQKFNAAFDLVKQYLEEILQQIESKDVAQPKPAGR